MIVSVPLTITSASADNGTIDNGVYTPNANFNGTDTITYVINDSDVATLTVTVEAVNDQTTVTNSTTAINEDTTLTVDLTANATDVDGDTLTITSASAVNGSIVDGVYTPDIDFNGTDTITYVINDSETATLTVTVDAVNDAPVLDDSNFHSSSVTEDMTSGFVTFNFDDGEARIDSYDVDGDTVSYSLSGVGSEKFTVDSNGNITINSDADIDYEQNFDPITRLEQVYNITVIADDGNGGIVEEPMVIEINDLRSSYSSSVSLWAEETPTLNYFTKRVFTPFKAGGLESDVLTTFDIESETTEVNAFGNPYQTISHSINVNDLSDSLVINNNSSFGDDNGSTVYWGYWEDSSVVFENGDTLTGTLLTITEERSNDEMNLPVSGTLNYGIAAKSPVFFAEESDVNGILASAELGVNFSTNVVTAQFEIQDGLSEYDPVLSSVVTADLDTDTGRFSGQTGGWDFVNNPNGSLYLDESIDNIVNTDLSTGDVTMSGAMMGVMGSHVGIVYGIAVEDGVTTNGEPDVAWGTVLFEAISAE